MALVWAALGWFGLGLVCVVTIITSSTVVAPPVTAGFAAGALVLPLAALLLGIAAVIEQRAGSRAVLLASALAVLTAATALLAGAMAIDPEAGPFLAYTSVLLLCAPVLLLVSILTVYYAARAWPEMRNLAQEERSRRAVEILTARGEASLDEIAVEINLPPDEVDDLVNRLAHSGKLAATIDFSARRVYTIAALMVKEHRLPGLIGARGQISLQELGRELGISQDRLKAWIYALVQRGGFSGYLNWQDGMLYSADAEKLRSFRGCPQCGGKLSLAGKGVILCQHCGSEIFHGA
jgi:DNA-binding Lrp family transcriptional regulator